MRRVNKFLSVFLALIMIFSIIPMSTVTASAEDVATSGTCGENVYWNFDESTGTLTISGTGEMELSIPWKAFEPEITRVVFEEGVTSVADLTFLNEDGMLSNLKEVELSNTITYIGGSAFNMCDGLTSIIIPDSVTLIEYDAFSQCVGLTKAIVGNGTTRIGMGAFYGCKNLKTVELGENLEQIGWNAFSSCTSLINMHIPAKVSKISDSFINCTSLKSFSVDTKNEYFSNDESGALLNKKQTHLVFYPAGSGSDVYRFPKTVETIGYAAFNFSKLKQVILSENLKEISSYSFASCTELESVFMHDSITNIYSNAFNDCTSLSDIYYSSSEEKWNKIEIDSENDCLLNATIHFNYFVEHAHSYTAVVTPPTCTEQGYTTYTCACGDSYVDNYVSATGHTAKTITIPTTCTVAGMSYNVCEICGETVGDATVIPATGHTSGEWEVVLEPTYEADGKKVKKCTVCGDTVEEEIIPMLVKITVTDEETGVSMDYDKNSYNGEVEIVVEESFDGTAFDVIDTSLNASQKFIYDITMTVDGETVQPTGTVTVRIPLPAGYDPNRSFVYHIDTTTGKVEKMSATYEDGYLVFETTHFSYYAVVEEYNYTFSIQEPSRTEIRNKDGIVLHAVIEGNAPDGSYVKWESSNGNFDEDTDGSNLKIIAKNKGWTTFTAILCDADGNELARDSVEMYSKSGFFDKIGGFFRSLFGTTKVYDK